MAIKKANMEYISEETEKYLKTPFEFDFGSDGGVATREGTRVELIYSPNWDDWMSAMYWTAFNTWNNGHEINLNRIIEDSEDINDITISFLKERPISACLESAVFIFSIENIPRTMTHQIVRHRGMSFNQESFRVSPCHHADIRMPDNLTEEQKNLYAEQAQDCRESYKRLIEEGVPIEQARNIMPMGTCTSLTMTTNLKHLQAYIKARTMDISQDEHTYIVALILKQLKNNANKFYEHFIKTDKTEEIMKIYL